MIYPAWIVGVLFSLVIYLAGYSVPWAIFWPVRALMKPSGGQDNDTSQRQ